ncbi:hypothetical protein J5N97_027337 [Dioscorea zingiberensis]|uniref:Glycosyltransferase n=1 Tax=Dioscorea zingiberensis TaxID=325984 RepID=A0A9D5H7J0_9LILI|nr:hypothetical protein J5N97_027337 [Dioscorea zingiberensis]
MAKLLLHHHNNLSITILIAKLQIPVPGYTSAVNSIIQSVDSTGLDIHFEYLPPVEPPPLDHDGIEDYISRFMQNNKPHVKSFITGLQSTVKVAALIIDCFATAVIDVADELGVPTYVYYTSGAATLALTLHLPTLHENIRVEFEEFGKNVTVPGVLPLPPQCMPVPLMNKKIKCYTWLVYHGRRICEAKGIIVNTFAELEPEALKAIAAGHCVPDHPTPTVYPVGPVLAIREVDKGEEEAHECVKWLDQQPAMSVVYLCFGSMGSFKRVQLIEMASALEKCGHRFLWRLNLSMHEDEIIMPEELMALSGKKGLVWNSWAPQVEILAHPAVGGFVTHCGWNSCLESLWFGVPMIAWPLAAEQHFNAFEMVMDMGVALELEVDRKLGGFVAGEKLEKSIRCLMEDCEEGNRVRARVAEMKLLSRRAVGEGGSSFASLKSLIEDFCSHVSI